MHVAAGVLLGLGLGEALQRLADPGLATVAFRAYVLGPCALQFALIAYNPRLMVPYRSDQQADERLGARLGGLPGHIFAPDLDGFVRGSDKGEQPLMGAVDEIEGGFGGVPTAGVGPGKPSSSARFRSGASDYVVLSEDDCCLKQSRPGQRVRGCRTVVSARRRILCPEKLAHA